MALRCSLFIKMNDSQNLDQCLKSFYFVQKKESYKVIVIYHILQSWQEFQTTLPFLCLQFHGQNVSKEKKSLNNTVLIQFSTKDLSEPEIILKLIVKTKVLARSPNDGSGMNWNAVLDSLQLNSICLSFKTVTGFFFNFYNCVLWEELFGSFMFILHFSFLRFLL